MQPQGDYVHISSTAFEASGHGWWTKTDCDANEAIVVVTLQEYYSDGSWLDKGTRGSETVPPGTGGSANRVTARAACTGDILTAWRSVVEAYVDTAGGVYDYIITDAQNIDCRQG